MSYQRNILTRIPCLFVSEATKLRQDTPNQSVVLYKAKETLASAGVVQDKFYWVAEDGSHNLFTNTGTSGAVVTDTISESNSAAGVTVDGVLNKDGSVTVGTGGAIVTDTVSEKTSAAGVTVDGALIKDGGISANSMFAGFFPITAQQALTGSGAVNVTAYYTVLNTTGGGTYTLANGTQVGQMKKVLLGTDSGTDAVITPVSLTGGTTITMNDATDYVILIWTGTAWVVIENSGATIA